VIKKPITYTDFDGKTVTNNFYFNFTKAEIISILAKDQNVIERFQKAMKSGVPSDYIEPFEWIVSKAFGVRRNDLFLKTDDDARAFLTSEPYSELFTELLTDAEKAIEFFNGVFPKDMIDEANAEILGKKPETVDLPSEDSTPAEPEDTRPAWVRENRVPTKKELMAMSPEEIASVMRSRTNRS